MKNSISNSYERMINDEEQKKRDRASGDLMKRSDLDGLNMGNPASDYFQSDETYVETEREYQKRNPNTAEFKAESDKRKQEQFDLENKKMEKLNRLKANKPWLFGYGAGAMQTRGLAGL